jgi:hypothetical protein
VKIPYTIAGVYNVKANGTVQEETEWNDDLKQPEPLSKKTCGENRFVSGSANFLEFYITPDCTITIAPRDAIRGLVRMEWTMDEFWAEGGTSKFIDKVSTALGIDAHRIYTIQVYEGSVVVEFRVLAPLRNGEDNSETTEDNEWDKTRELLQKKIKDDPVNTLGAPVLGYVEDGVLVFGDDIPPP